MTHMAQFFQTPKDLENLTELERIHLPKISLPPVVEDGASASIVCSVDHPMDEDHYIKSIQIMNFADPIVIKGKFFLTPVNGEAYLSTQIRLSGGEGTVWVIAECNKHGKWAASKKRDCSSWRLLKCGTALIGQKLFYSKFILQVFFYYYC